MTKTDHGRRRIAEYVSIFVISLALHKAMHSASETEVDAYLRCQHLKGNIGPDLLSRFLESDLPDLFCKALALSSGETEQDVKSLLGGGGISGLELILHKTNFDRGVFPMIVAGFVERLPGRRRYRRATALKQRPDRFIFLSRPALRQREHPCPFCF